MFPGNGAVFSKVISNALKLLHLALTVAHSELLPVLALFKLYVIITLSLFSPIKVTKSFWIETCSLYLPFLI